MGDISAMFLKGFSDSFARLRLIGAAFLWRFCNNPGLFNYGCICWLRAPAPFLAIFTLSSGALRSNTPFRVISPGKDGDLTETCATSPVTEPSALLATRL